MDSAGEGGPEAAVHKGWHLWHFGGVFYARRVDPKTSPPVVLAGSTEKELDGKIAAYEQDGRPPWADRVT